MRAPFETPPCPAPTGSRCLAGTLPRKLLSTIYWDDEMLASLGRDSQLYNKTLEAKVRRRRRRSAVAAAKQARRGARRARGQAGLAWRYRQDVAPLVERHAGALDRRVFTYPNYLWAVGVVNSRNWSA